MQLRFNTRAWCTKIKCVRLKAKAYNQVNTLRTGDADLRFYITTVQDGDANLRF